MKGEQIPFTINLRERTHQLHLDEQITANSLNSIIKSVFQIDQELVGLMD